MASCGHNSDNDGREGINGTQQFLEPPLLLLLLPLEVPGGVEPLEVSLGEPELQESRVAEVSG